ncbi:MAG: crossover junction endodeoxyribonuclease RuvC [Clostridia bacterium]|nr:crossover junction endodeoxyribonuclease RuvC [Clostridia bacterium]
MTILGIDPGIGIVGYGLINAVRRRISPIAHGVITTPKENSVPSRLLEIRRDLCDIIEKFHPDAAAIEELFYKSNQKTVIPVAEARGVIVMTLEEHGIPIYEYTPLQAKMSLTGYGRAEKKQMMEMTRIRLGLESVPRPDDAADALAIALCHACTAGLG